jgi:hypothetical protein
MKNFFKVSAVLLVLTGVSFAQESVNPFAKGTNAIGFHFETFWFVANGGMLNFDHGAFNNMLSMGGDFGFHGGVPNSIWDGIRVMNYDFRLGFHPFGIPLLEDRGFGERNDVYLLVKAGMLHAFYNKSLFPTSDNYAKFDWSFGIGERFFIGRNFFLSLEVAISGLAAGLGFAF